MKPLLTTAFLLLTAIFATAQQKPVVLHPVVGDTIDRTEKTAYLLFPQFADSVFGYAWIEDMGGNFVLHARLTDHVILVPFDTLQMAEYRMHVEKLSAWYASQAQDLPADSTISLVVKKRAGEKQNYELTEEMWRKIKKEANHYAELSHQADMQGLSGRAREDYINTSGTTEIRFDAGKK